MPVKVKICGITNVPDATMAVSAGADALGFMFYEGSPRHVSLTLAADIIRTLPPLVARVGVFVNPTEEEVRLAIAKCGLDTLQFHGEESPSFCARFHPWKTMKAFRIRDADSLQALGDFPTDAWLLDSYQPGKLGGTGATFNWDLARKASGLGKPVLLAGGLTASNVGEAIQHVQPYGVDVSSGVESEPGKKDEAKVRQFIAKAKSVIRS